MPEKDPAPTRPSSLRKHRAMLDAAEVVFLADGFLGANMDQLAELAGVSKQTVYKHFGSKEALFVELVGSMTRGAGDGLHDEDDSPSSAEELEPFLRAYAERQLEIVLSPRLLRLRRLVIGEVGRFPDLARVVWQEGPRRAVTSLAGHVRRCADLGLLRVADPMVAAEHLNWLVMAAPVNDAMFLGDDHVPGPAELRAHTDEAVRIFLAAYGVLA